MKAGCVKINETKIREYFAAKNMPYTSLGPQLGRGKNFLSSAFGNDGYMNEHAYDLQMRLWDMPYDIFLEKEPEEVVEVPVDESVAINDDVSKIIELLTEMVSLQKQLLDIWNTQPNSR